VIKDEPSWQALPAGAADRGHVVLRRCLVKEPAQRLRDVADVRILLGESETEPAHGRATSAAVPLWREALAWLLAVAGLGAAAATAWRLSVPQSEPPSTQFTVPVGPENMIAFLDVPALAISPDGRRLALTVSGASERTTIHLCALDETEARPLAGTEGGSGPFFSPDGESLGFFAEGRLLSVSLAGGPVVTVAQAATLATSSKPCPTAAPAPT